MWAPIPVSTPAEIFVAAILIILSLKIEFSLVDIVIFAKGKNNLYAHIIWNNSFSLIISFSILILLITGLNLGKEIEISELGYFCCNK